MRPEQAAVIAVGDITLDELQQQLEASLGAWKSAAARAGRARFRLAPTEPDALVLIDKPHAAQSVIHVALVGAGGTRPISSPRT